MWWTDYWPMPWALIGPAMMVLFIVFCFVMMMACMRRGGMRHRYRDRDSAVDILRERYARGEIDQTEYDQRRRALSA